MVSSEMLQIHTQGSHFSRLLVTVDFDDGFNTKMCSVDHIIIVVYINDVFQNVANPYAGVTLFKALGLVWSGLSFPCMEYNTDGGKA